MAGDGVAAELQRVRRPADPIGHGLDAGLKRTFGAAVSGQVQRQGVVAVVSEITALQNPNAVIEPAAVNENHARLFRIERAGAGVGVGAFAVDAEFH